MLSRSSLLLLSLICLGAVELAACGAGSGGGSGTAGTGTTTGTAGNTTTGTAGNTTTGTAGNTTTGTAGNTTTGTAGNTTTGTAGSGTTGSTTGTAGAPAGTTGTAGGGAAGAGGGAAGAAGTAGAAGSGAAGAGGVVKSTGCGKDVTDQPSQWKQHNIMVTVGAAYTAKYSARIYWTKPPIGYDNTKPYPLILWGQGCGQGPTPENIPPSENPLITGTGATPGKAVIVQLLAPQGQPNHCYSAGPDGDAADSPEIPYFDQVVSELEATYCIDKSKIFEGGYSSGGWEASLMSCVRTNVLRGTGWAAAGLQKNHDPCMGPVAALITRDMKDGGTPADQTLQAVESIRMRNGCATTTKPWTPIWNAGEGMADTSSCVTYDGCMAGYPLVWCLTNLGGHTNTEGDTHLTRYGLWKLWSTLP
jgi:polyhydroxybutyrate depolymerase